MLIRDAIAADLPGIIDIYNAAVPGRLATADTEPISVASRIAWQREHDSNRHPLWVAVSTGEVPTGSRDPMPDQPRGGHPGDLADDLLGWISFQPFYGRPAYRATAELSVYVSPSRHRAGVGRALLERAVEAAPNLGLKTLLAFIFGHNAASLALFESCGFERHGLLPRVAELDGIERDLVLVGRRVTDQQVREPDPGLPADSGGSLLAPRSGAERRRRPSSPSLAPSSRAVSRPT